MRGFFTALKHNSAVGNSVTISHCVLLRVISQKHVRVYIFFVCCSIWMWFLPSNSKQIYGASVTLGFGGSMLLVTALTMLADLIGENVVSAEILDL